MTAKLSIIQARRLALHAQGLAAQAEAGATVDEVVSRIGCLQLDPVGVVAKSPLLVLRARMRGGTHDSHAAALERTAYRDRTLFDYWCHEASLCHVDDLPIHRWAMRTYLQRLTPAKDKVRVWLDENASFAEHTLAALRDEGALMARDLEDRSDASWDWGHWTDEVSSRQTVARMIETLWQTGEVGVSARVGMARLWDLMERCLPPGALADADADPLPEAEVVRSAVLRSVSMLGVGRAPHIAAHFTRRKYPGMGGAGTGVLGDLEASGALARVKIDGLRGDWWCLPEALDSVATLEAGRRTLALSPFDNLLCDRARTAELFGFDHRLEIYVPPAKRRWGYYVLPILHGERLIARADLKAERNPSDHVLRVLSLHHEPGRKAPGAVKRALRSLAHWRGAELALPS